MRKITNMLLVGAIFLAGAGMIALTMQTDTVQAAYGSGPGSGWGGCPAYGSGYSGYSGYNMANTYSGNYELTVESIEDALGIAQEQIDADVKEENIYQMGRWWVVYYMNDDGVVMRSYIDAFTGDVLDTTTQSYDYSNTGRGYGMMYGAGYGMGHGPGMGYSRMYRY
ncbi:PepSY domain-containing protein [Methanococcoides orientis]|uniref:PepSY domain-containing protein n=1 Tax=Methanococcoides orientis TaxID=2822137 RepID=UPI001E2C8D3A|nr:PepSY domain-containing protein [Methanococcoides orientis]UGV41543.1 PepSY domain-containing protein [Methanococcoides orientis]